MGKIRVLKIYNRFARVDDDPELKKWPKIPGYERFNVCKNSSRYQELSPMLLGPVKDENGERYALNIEDGWQGSKVYPLHVKGYDGGRKGGWQKNWTEYSKRARFSGEARRHRRPSRDKGKVIDSRNPNAPLFSYYMGDRLLYMDARERMYMPWYAELAKETKAFLDLKNRLLAGKNLLLLEYDGLDRRDPRKNRDLDENMLCRLIRDPCVIYGHGLGLASCLLDLRVWEYSEEERNRIIESEP